MTKVCRDRSAMAESIPHFSKQRGMSFIIMMIVLSVGIFFTMFGLKVGPSYMEYMTVAKIADDLTQDPALLKSPRSKVNQYLNKAYRTNNLWDLKAEDTIKLAKDGKRGYIVTVNYEVRTNLFANIDVVTSFNKIAGTP